MFLQLLLQIYCFTVPANLVHNRQDKYEHPCTMLILTQVYTVMLHTTIVNMKRSIFTYILNGLKTASMIMVPVLVFLLRNTVKFSVKCSLQFRELNCRV